MLPERDSRRKKRKKERLSEGGRVRERLKRKADILL